MVTIKGEEVGTLGTMPVCEICGSERVVHDAWACWNRDYAIWELETVFDQMYCRQCEAETRFTWRRVETGPRIAVRDLNDRLRQQGLGNGSVMITTGLQERGEAFIRKAVDAVRAFDAFTEANDPWGEHDFGAIEINGEKVFWKIDAYDPSLTTESFAAIADHQSGSDLYKSSDRLEALGLCSGRLGSSVPMHEQ